MHTLRVHAAVMRRLRERSHVSAKPAAAPIETLRDADGCTHIVCDGAACAAVFDDDGFVPSDIASAVSSVGQSFGIDVTALQAFLRHTPLLASGADHKAKRSRFMQHHHQMRRRHAGFMLAAAERHVAALGPAPTGAVSDALVAPYVDAVLRQIFAGERVDGGPLYDGLACHPSSMLELIHHPRLLGKTCRGLDEFSSGFDRSTATEGTASGDIDDAAATQVLLAYVLMGRGPLIGALSAFMHDLLLTPRPAAQLAGLLDDMSASRLFQLTAAVNFTGRTATAERHIAGVLMRPGDRLLLMLPFANADMQSAPSGAGMAFGNGPHTCAGAALSLEMAGAYLVALRRHATGWDWSGIEPQAVVPGVFQHYS